MSKYVRMITSEYLMYLRKSRKDNPNETIEEVLEKHERILQDYALKTFGYRISDKDIYREVVSGETIEDRPKIKEMYERLENDNNIKGVLVVDVQRLSRGDLLDCGITVRNFKYTNTLIITPTKSYDLNDKYDRKFFEMELSRGSDYLDYTKEILERGRVASAKRGNYVRSIAPYGYDRVKIDKNWTLKPNEKEAPYIPMIFEMYSNGIGTNRIAHKLDELGAKPRVDKNFNETTIMQMIKNPVYIGKIKLNERKTVKVVENGKLVKKRIRNKHYDVVDGIHQPLVSEDIFYKCQDIIGRQSRHNKNNDLKFIYASLIKCGICGKAIILRKYSNTKPRVDRIVCRNGYNCKNVSHNYYEIHDAIINELKRYLKDFELLVDTNTTKEDKSHETLLRSLLDRLTENQKKLDSICGFLESGVYTTEMFINRKNILENEKDTIEKAIEEAKKEMNHDNNIKNKIVSLHKALDMLNDETISAKLKNNFLKDIIEVIYYKKVKKSDSGDYNITIDIILK